MRYVNDVNFEFRLAEKLGMVNSLDRASVERKTEHKKNLYKNCVNLRKFQQAYRDDIKRFIEPDISDDVKICLLTIVLYPMKCQ